MEFCMKQISLVQFLPVSTKPAINLQNGRKRDYADFSHIKLQIMFSLLGRRIIEITCIGRTEETFHASMQILCWKLTDKWSFYSLSNFTIFFSSHSKNITDSKSYILVTIAGGKKKKVQLTKILSSPVRGLALPSLKLWPAEQRPTDKKLRPQQIFAQLKNCTTRPDLGEQFHFLSWDFRPTIDRVGQHPFLLPHPKAEAQKCQMHILQAR